ncbi:hypothetical protein B0H12DRAFT_1242336 [Mycena haematopus]|nr:hypothetical protein B0H12DRAFT_1242336 [Mycena haematopus]
MLEKGQNRISVAWRASYTFASRPHATRGDSSIDPSSQVADNVEITAGEYAACGEQTPRSPREQDAADAGRCAENGGRGRTGYVLVKNSRESHRATLPEESRHCDRLDRMRPTRDEMQRMEGESEHTGDALQVKNWERVVQKGVAVAVKRQWCECAMPTLDLLERRPTHARVVPVHCPPFFARSPTQLYSPSPSSSYPNSSLAQRHLTSEAEIRGERGRDTLRGGKHGSAVAKHGGYGSAGVWGGCERARMRVRLQGASWECDRQQWIMQTKGMPTRWAQVERDGTAAFTFGANGSTNAIPALC